MFFANNCMISRELIVTLQKDIFIKERNKDMNKRELMARAIKLSEESVKAGGGPFGAVIA